MVCTEKNGGQPPLSDRRFGSSLAGEIDFPRLRAAIERLVRENEGLRVQFYERDGQVQSYLADPGRVAVGWKDFSWSDDPQREMERWARAHLGAPFPMLDSPLYAFTLFRIAPKETGYFIKLHHLIADGWSVELITRRIQQAYESGPEEGLPAPTVLSWQSYLTAEQSMLHSSRMEEHVAFWVERLSPIPALELPDRPVGEAARERALCPPPSRRPRCAAWRGNGGSASTHCGPRWSISGFINGTGQTDVVLGIPLLGRSGRLERETIATFTNTMPVRLRIDGGAGAMEFVQAVAGELEEGYRHQKAPYLQVFHRLRAAYPGLERLYDVCVNCYNTLPAGSVGGLEAVNTEYPREVQEYSLQIILRSWNGTALQIDYDYRLDRYTRSQVARMHLELMLLLEQAAQAPARAVGKLCLLTPEEFRHRVYDWNQTNAPFPEKETVLDRVISMGEGFPDRPAVQFGEGSWSYAQLLCQTRRYAAWLWQQGVRPGMTVGLLAEHSPECLAGALAIFWCGGVYQPIDPSDPLPRVEELLALSGAGMLVVSRGQTAGRVPAIRLEEAPENWDDGLLPPPALFPNGLLYHHLRVVRPPQGGARQPPQPDELSLVGQGAILLRRQRELCALLFLCL